MGPAWILSMAMLLASPLSALQSRTYGRFNLKTYPDLPQSWVVIMGVTGAGKSSLTRQVFGNIDAPSLAKVCHGLEPCTQEVVVSAWKYKGTGLFLVDTPGFDDPHRSDEDILGEISQDLAELYESGVAIGAIILLHRITDDKLSHGTLRSLGALAALAGQKKLSSLVMVTTRWEKEDRRRALSRERELLKGPYWGPMIKAGAKYIRHDGTVKSAQDILDKAISFQTNTPLRIQEEIVTVGRSVEETEAMFAVTSYDFLEGLRQRLAKGEISGRQYIEAISEFMEKKRKENIGIWQSYGPVVRDILLAVGRTVLTGGVEGGVEGIVFEMLMRFIESYFQPTKTTETMFMEEETFYAQFTFVPHHEL